jgi:hypothetical protein
MARRRGEMDQPSSIDVLFRVYEVLRSRGIGAEVKFPGYVEIKDHDHIYSPGGGCWHHQHDKAKSWTRLDVREECRDAKQVANSIIAHLSATKKSV